MIKLVYCLRRKPGMTWDEFSTYWREVHAPLVAAHSFPTRRSSDLAGQELLEDEQNFIDLASSPIWFAEEWQVV